MLVEKGICQLPLYSLGYSEAMSPLIILASVLMFAAFSCFQIHADLSKLSALTMYIYLIHAVIVDLTTTVLRKIFLNDTNSIAIATLMILFVLAVSSALAVAYKHFWKAVDQKWSVSEKLCRLLKLL